MAITAAARDAKTKTPKDKVRVVTVIAAALPYIRISLIENIRNKSKTRTKNEENVRAITFNAIFGSYLCSGVTYLIFSMSASGNDAVQISETVVLVTCNLSTSDQWLRRFKNP